ncbi:UNVERIFIED_CONTAM: hypothetical protein GTU68_036661 [Idotea baltica]|nr:hypothetical protein [Idotea baltica]
MSNSNLLNGQKKSSRQNSQYSNVSNEVDVANGEGLKKSLNLGNAIAIIVGSIVGSGIFVSPKGVTVEMKSFGGSMIMWLVSGLISMLGAMCFAELALLIPSSGGEYMYVYKAMGPCAAFLRLWVEIIIIRPSIVAVLSIVFANYILVPIFPSCDPPSIAIRLMAALAICKFFCNNYLPIAVDS